MSPRLRRFVLPVAVIVAIGVAASVAVMAGLFEPSVVEASARAPLTPDQMKALVERGRYLTRMADCAACHTADGGAPFAGGRPFPMPFGTLYASNITPDPETGIGKWSMVRRNSSICSHGDHPLIAFGPCSKSQSKSH